MTDAYRVRIFESELRVICDETLGYPDIETGGNLYGLLSHGDGPIVWLATRPAGRVHRGQVSLELDHRVQQEIEESVWARYGIQFLGMWHSHHQIGLYEPSEGDRRRTAGYAARSRRKFYVEILCNLPRGGSVRPMSSEHVTATSDDDGIGADLAGEENDESAQSRRARRAQAKEQKRRDREAGHESENPAERPQEANGQERWAGPVHVTPFVYLDAVSLDQADAEFAILPGASPVRAAMAAAEWPDPLIDAFRPSSDLCGQDDYVLRSSNGTRHSDLRIPEPTAAGQVRDAAPGQGIPLQITMVPPTARRYRADARPIPDMAEYIHAYVEPLLRTQPHYQSSLEPDGPQKLLLRVEGRRKRVEMLLILGWDGTAPLVLSCAIMSGGRAVDYPERLGLDRHDLLNHFNWGIRHL